MKLSLRFSPHSRLEPFRSQCHSLHQLLQAAQQSVSALNEKVPAVLQYPADAIAASLPLDVRTALSRMFLRHRKSLHFDVEEFGLRFKCIDLQKVNIKKASNLALFRFATATHNNCAEEVTGRLDSLTKGEIALFLGMHPHLHSRFFALKTALTTSEEFAHLCQVYERGIIKELTPAHMYELLADLESTAPLLDINEFAKCARCFTEISDHMLRTRLMTRVVADAKALSPTAFVQAMKAMIETRTRLKEFTQIAQMLHSAFEVIDLKQLDDQMLVTTLECFQRIGFYHSSHLKQALALDIETRMKTADPVWRAKLHTLRAIITPRKDQKATLLMIDRFLHTENADALVSLLPLLMGSESTFGYITQLLGKASLESLLSIVKLMKQHNRCEKSLAIQIENVLIERISDQMSLEAVELCCRIMGNLKHVNHYADKASVALGDIVAQHPEWITSERLITFTHQFAYVSRHSGVCKLIGEYLKQHQKEEVVSESVSLSDVHYYVEGGKFHKPQNTVLSSKSHGHLAVLIISLQRGRLTDAGTQEMMKQYLRCLVLFFPMLNVKHRSSLVLGASLRENFDITIWNEFAQATNAIECHAFNTEETMRSLSIYRTAAMNVKNIFRGFNRKGPQPLELVINGEVLETYNIRAKK